MKTFTYLWQYLAEFFVEWETHFILSNIYQKSVPFMRKGENMVDPERLQII